MIKKLQSNITRVANMIISHPFYKNYTGYLLDVEFILKFYF